MSAFDPKRAYKGITMKIVMNKLSRYVPCLAAIFVWAVLLGSVQAETVEGATYSIISDSSLHNIKRSIEVRLNKKISKEMLRTIALKLKNTERKKYKRTFIFYLLPDMKTDNMAWATTHFNPKLEVRILGLTVEEEERMVREAKSTPRNVVGVWKHDGMGLQVVTIYRENAKLYLEAKYKDGSGGHSKEMVEARSANGTKLTEKGDTTYGEYYILDKKGDLRIYDYDGIIFKYKKIQ